MGAFGMGLCVLRKSGWLSKGDGKMSEPQREAVSYMRATCVIELYIENCPRERSR